MKVYTKSLPVEATALSESSLNAKDSLEYTETSLLDATSLAILLTAATKPRVVVTVEILYVVSSDPLASAGTEFNASVDTKLATGSSSSALIAASVAASIASALSLAAFYFAAISASLAAWSDLLLSE